MGQDRLTLLDIAKQTDPDGGPAQVYEVLNQVNPMFEDAPAFPSNAPTGNRVTIRSSIPQPAFTKVNTGITRQKSSTEQKLDTMGIISFDSEVDSRLRKIVGAGNFDAARRNEDSANLEGFAELVCNTQLYGDERSNEAAFTGLATRMAALASVLTGSQVASYGSVTGGDGTSVFVVDWGERGCHMIYPPGNGSGAGLEIQDKGEQRVNDADSNPFWAFVTNYNWMGGITVKDPRHIARLANIDISAAQGDTNFSLGLGLIDLLTAMPAQNGMQRVAYCHQRIFAAFMKQAINKSNSALRIDDYLGRPTPYFWDVPIRRCDQISGAESTVS